MLARAALCVLIATGALVACGDGRSSGGGESVGGQNVAGSDGGSDGAVLAGAGGDNGQNAGVGADGGAQAGDSSTAAGAAGERGTRGGSDNGGANNGGANSGGANNGGANNGGANATTAFPACASPSYAELNAGQVFDVDNLHMPGSTKLIDLGVSTGPIFQAGDRVLSARGAPGAWEWVLWDTPNRRRLTTGAGTVASLRGSVFLTTSRDGSTFEIHAVSDGHLQGTVGDNASTAGLATDGSYLWTLRNDGVLAAWSPTGSLLQAFAGSYSLADVSISAQPGHLQVLGGASGSQVVEYLDVLTGSKTVSTPFLGAANSWFQDGSHFFTLAFGQVLRIYTSAAALAWSANLPSSAIVGLGGTGQYFWYDGITVNKIVDANNATPVATISSPTLQNSDPDTIVTISNGVAQVLRLRETVAERKISLPITGGKGFAIDAADHWSVVNDTGVLFHSGTGENPNAAGFLGCGTATSVAGSDSGLAVVSTASGQTVVLDTLTKTVRQTIAPSTSDGGKDVFNVDGGFAPDHLAISSDGRVLAGHTFSGLVGSGQIAAFTLPATATPYLIPDPDDAFCLSRGGTRLAIKGTNQVTDVFGGNAIDLVPTPQKSTPRLSPSGAHIAVTDWEPTNRVYALPAASLPQTTLYDGGTIVNVIPGAVVGWIDDGHVLIATYSLGSKFRIWTYVSSSVYTDQGTFIGAVPGLPWIGEFYTVSPSQILPVESGNIYDLSTGALVFDGRGYGTGRFALAGPSVLDLRDDALFIVPH